MLQFIRDKSQGFIAWAVILLIAGVFAVLGLSDYLNTRGGSGEAALVNGDPISWNSVDKLYQRVLYEQEVPVGGEQALKAQIVAALAQQHALLLGLKAQGFVMSPEHVIEALKKNSAFAVEGQFSKEQFKTLVARAGYTEAEYVQELSQELLRNQVTDGLSLSTLALNRELVRAVQLLDQTRDIGYIILPTREYRSEVSKLVSDSQVKQYYKDHQSQFIFPEQVALDYIEFSVNGLMPTISVTESDLKAFYEQNPDLFSRGTQVHARHILVSTMNGDTEAAKTRAENILAKIKQGEDFASIAKAESDDTLSATEGGDLKWFGKGAMVPEFEQAVFALQKPGDIAGPVQTSYGYHIIQLVERKDAEKRSFDESKALVEEHYRKQKAETLFDKMKEQLTALRRDNTQQLKPIAEALGVSIETTPLFAKQGEVFNGTTKNTHSSFITHPEIRKAAFSTAVLEAKNSPIINIEDPNDPKAKHLAIVHLNQHQPVRPQSLEEARTQIVELLASEEVKEKVKKLGEDLAQKLKEGKQSEADTMLADLSKTHQLEWIKQTNLTRANQELDRELIREAFNLPVPDLKTAKPSVTSFALSNGDYVVLALNHVKLGDIDKMDSGTKDSYQKSMNNMNHQIEFGSYLNEIFSKTKVKFFPLEE